MVVDLGWVLEVEEDCYRMGVMIGVGIGGLFGIEEFLVILYEWGFWWISFFFIFGRLINLVLGYVLIEFGFIGLNYVVVIVCFFGVYVIGDVVWMIMFDDVDVMVVGGVEVVICLIGIVGFVVCKVFFMGFNDDF